MAKPPNDRRAGLSRLALAGVLLGLAVLIGNGVVGTGQVAGPSGPGRVVTENALTQDCSVEQRSSVVGRLGCARLRHDIRQPLTARFQSAPPG